MAKKSRETPLVLNCPICKSAKFSTTRGLKSHINAIHLGVKFSCKDCGKSFRSKNFRNRHIEVVHNRIKRIKCNFCDLTFSWHNDRIVHTNKAHRNFLPEDQKVETICQQCGKDFSSARNLSKHVDIVHRGIKTFKCDICPRSFGSKDNLKSHVDVTHKNIRFECEICSNRYTLSSNLKRHIKLFHQGQQINSIVKANPSLKKESLKSNQFRCETCKLEFLSQNGHKVHLEDIHDTDSDSNANPFQINQNLLAQDPYRMKLVVPLKAMFV